MSAEDEKHRQRTEQIEKDLDALIRQENDPDKRLRLMLLQNLNTSVVAVHSAVTQTQTDVAIHRVEFQEHLKEFTRHCVHEEAILNRGRGAWWVISISLVLMQAFAAYSWKVHRDEITKMQDYDNQSQLVIEKLKAKIDYLESRK